MSDQIQVRAPLPSRKERRYRWIGGCVGHRVGGDVLEKSKIQREEKQILNKW